MGSRAMRNTAAILKGYTGEYLIPGEHMKHNGCVTNPMLEKFNTNLRTLIVL